ncbi:MAG: hypothetical protein GYA24_23555 [Candidatus Lokiarchaeota archaeon]|nr:hypothetical protein [Candidatus Lokiarchaeota archaeon]
MKSATRYIDLDDVMQPAPRPPTTARPVQATPVQVPAQQSIPPSNRARGWGAVGCGVAATIFITLLASHGSAAGDPAAAIAAWLLLPVAAGTGIAILLSWLAARSAGTTGLSTIEVPAPGSRVTRAWSAIPLRPHLGTRYLARAMKQHPAVRYRYVLSFKECKLGTFVARAGMGERYRRAIAAMNPQQRAAWYDAVEGGWVASLEASVSAAGPAALASATGAMDAALAGTFHQVTFARHPVGRREVYLLGEEITPEAAVPKELAPDVPSGVAVEAHAPVAMRIDIPLGKVVEPETLDAIAPAGILHAHLEGGLVVAGGRVAERVATLKLVLAHVQAFTPVVIDDHGDYHLPGATILVPGQGCTINPLVPATPDPRHARQHGALAIAALAAIHAFSQDQEAFLATRVQELLDAAAVKGLAPGVKDLAGLLASDAKSAGEKGVALAIQRDVAGWASGWMGMQDTPGLEALVLAGKPVVFDLSGVPGAEKQVLKAMLLLKIISLGSIKARKPVLAVVPDIDKVFHDERSDKLPPRVAQAIDKVVNALAGSVSRFATTVQDPVKLPQQVLAHAAAVVAFRQPSPQARDVITQALGLEDEQLYDRSRHASYQHKYLSELPPGTCFLRRPDVASPFLVAVDMDAAGKLLPRREVAGQAPSPIPSGDPLESALLQFGLVKQDVVDLLGAMQRSGNQGVKRDWMADILAGKCQATIARREPDLPSKDLEARGRELAGRIMDTLVARGILTEDGFNPSGLKKGVTTKMTQYGQAALEHAAPARPAVVAMDADEERALKMEQLIGAQYPDGDVAALGERLLSEVVSIFQAISERGEIDEHAEILARCNEHAATLGAALEDGDRPAIVEALGAFIDDYRQLPSTYTG